MTENFIKSGWSLKDIDEADFYSLLDYAEFKDNKYVIIGGKTLIKKTADEVNWL